MPDILLIGLVPSFGSLAKGILKIIFSYIRKFGTRGVEIAVDASVEALSLFLHDQKVVKILGSYDIGKCCKKAAAELRSVKSSLDASGLSKLFRKLMDNFRLLIKQVERFSQDGELVRMLYSKYNDLVAIQSKIDDKLSKCFAPLSDILERIACRLEAIAIAGKTALTNTLNIFRKGGSKRTWAEMPGKTDNIKKALYGELISDEYMKAKGHQSLLPDNREAIDNLTAKPRGAYFVDGIYKKKPPDEGYIITEVKFRTGGDFGAKDLSMTEGSWRKGVEYPAAKQMSDDWILPRIRNDPALTPEQIKDITKSYERWLIVVDENGKITGPIKLDAFANAIP